MVNHWKGRGWFTIAGVGPLVARSEADNGTITGRRAPVGTLHARGLADLMYHTRVVQYPFINKQPESVLNKT